jgi:hypothetical protein
MDNLALNAPILFGENGNYRRFTVRGWSDPDNPVRTWTDSHVAELEFKVGLLKRDPLLRIEAVPFLADSALPYQELGVYLNGLWLNYVRATNHVVFDTRVPRTYLSTQRNLLSFVMPRATCPRDEGWNEDERSLGFAFLKVELLDS